MDVGEGIMWILRIAAALFITGILVVLVILIVPQPDVSVLHADMLGARILSNGGFSERPGIVDTSKFTQDVADAYYVVPEGALHEDLGARAWLTNVDGSSAYEAIFYNRGAYLKNAPFAGAGIGTVDYLYWTMPVVTTRDEQLILHVEVLNV